MLNNRPVKLRNIVFDLGAVLLHWHPQEIVAAFTPDQSLQAVLLQQVFHHNDWQRLDKGNINERQAIDCFARNTNLSTRKISELMALVKQSLLAKEDTVALLLALKEQHRLFCLSNICTEIYDFVSDRYTFFNEFEDVVVSAQVNMIKPDPAIFKYMLNRFNIAPENTLFIDDIPANIAAAQELGIHGVQFVDATDCKAAIEKITG
jgi:putative hydrolase of the HAD superfamily